MDTNRSYKISLYIYGSDHNILFVIISHISQVKFRRLSEI